MCLEDKLYFSGDGIPFYCSFLGLECEQAAEEPEAAEGESTPRVTGRAVATCCPEAAIGRHLPGCPVLSGDPEDERRYQATLEDVRRRMQAARREEAEGTGRRNGRGRTARGGRGKGRGRGRPPASTQDSASTSATGTRQELTRTTWAQLDALNLEELFENRVRTLQQVPKAFRGKFRAALCTTLERVLEAEREGAKHKERAWKLWCLLPRMLLRTVQGSSSEGRKQLQERFALFWQGKWVQLARAEATVSAGTAEDTLERRLKTACSKVRLGEASRGAQTLTSGKLPPGNRATLAELKAQRRSEPDPEAPLQG